MGHINQHCEVTLLKTVPEGQIDTQAPIDVFQADPAGQDGITMHALIVGLKYYPLGQIGLHLNSEGL